MKSLRALAFLIFTILPIGVFASIPQDKIGASQPEKSEMQWNRYVTDNFEILSVDDGQGKYLYDNIEFIKVWITWRWGMKNFDFPVLNNGKGESVKVRCKLICVHNAGIYEKLFNRKTPAWRIETKNGIPEYTVWLISEGEKWNTKMPAVLTEVVLNNFEANTGIKFPVWCNKGMSLVNSRLMDIRASVPFATDFDSKTLLNMTQEGYNKLTDAQKAGFDAQAAMFCLWARQEYNGKVFLDFLSGSTINPEYCLQYFGVKTYAECDLKVKAYLSKLPGGSDYYFTW